MKKVVLVYAGLVLFLSGCATYNFNRGDKPYDSGYVVSRGNQTILEYTLGQNNSVPELDIAKERFKRRKSTVEQYYEKMGEIDTNFQRYFVKPGSTFMGVVSSPFRLPFVAMKNYKYEHNEAYREKIDKIEDEKDVQKRQRLKELKDALDSYIKDDLSKYEKVSVVQETPKEEVRLEVQAQETQPAQALPQEAQPAVTETPGEEVKTQEAPATPQAQVPAEEPKQEEAAPVEELKQEAASPAQEEPQAVTQPEQEKAVVPEVKIEEPTATGEESKLKTEEAKASEQAKETKVTSEQSAEVTSPAPQEAPVAKEVRKKTIWQKIFRAKVAEEPKGESVSEETKPVEQKPRKSLWSRMFGPKKKKEAVEVAKKEEPLESAQTEELKEIAQPQTQETLAQEEQGSAAEAKPKTSLWQRMFKKKPKEPAVATEAASKEEVVSEEKPKERFWNKLFKPKEKAPVVTTPEPGEPPQAVIIAKPLKGYSPLRVNFYGGSSRAAKGRIISYEWDFGDGDKSTKRNAVNTFWSGSFDPKVFTVTLTVQDDRGNKGTATADIEVLNK